VAVRNALALGFLLAALVIMSSACAAGRDSLLLKASADGDTSQVKTLLAEGADVNFRQGCRTPLLNAVAGNHPETVSVLLKAGANDNERDCDGRTPLLFAAQHGYDEVRTLIFRKGEPLPTPTPPAYASLKPANGRAELNEQLFSLVGNVIATEMGQSEVPANLSAARELIAKGADVNAVDSGQTLLIRAAQNGHIEMMRLLLGHGADVNGRDDRGRTALMVAAGSDDVDMVELLLSKGADVNLKDNDGFTAWSGSEVVGGSKDPKYVRMRHLLRQAGAK